MTRVKLAVVALALMVSACTTPSNVTVNADIGIDAQPTIAATVTPQATAIATVQPPVANPVRVQFARGTYGTTLTGNGNQAFLLWARGGQVMTVNPQSDKPMSISLLAPDGQQVAVQVVEGVGTYSLPANGDYTLSLVTDANYKVEMEIR